MKAGWILRALVAALVALGVTSCKPAGTAPTGPVKYPYQVTATVGMIADIVRNVAGEHAEVELPVVF